MEKRFLGKGNRAMEGHTRQVWSQGVKVPVWTEQGGAVRDGTQVKSKQLFF